MSPLTDDQLLRRFVERDDAEAFGEIVRRHAGLVHATCRRETRDDALAEDAAQATFLVLARKARALREERSLASWLFATARLVARNLLREETRRRAREVKASAEMERAMNPDPWEAIEPHLNDALARLGSADRQAVILRVLEGRSFAEVAAETGLGESAARMRVARAVERLRANLGRGGVTVGASALVALLERDASAAVPPSVLAVSAPSAASPVGGMGAWPVLAKGTTLLLATTTTKALVASGLTLAVAGGFVAARSRPVIDDATIRAAFRPLIGTWKGTGSMSPDGSSTAIQVDFRPLEDGKAVSMSVRFPAMHQGDRKEMRIDPSTGHLTLTAAGKTVDYTSEGLRELAVGGRGTLVFTGPPAKMKGLSQIVASLKVEGDHLTMRQELRPFGEAPKVNETKLERVR